MMRSNRLGSKRARPPRLSRTFGLPGGGVRRIRKYLLVAGIHVAFLLFTLRELGVLGLGFALIPLMVAWPLVLLAISESPRLRAALEEPTLGPDRGLALIDATPGYAAVVIDANRNVRFSAALKSR